MNRQSGKITALYCRLAHYDKDLDFLTARNQQEILLNYAIANHLENPCFYCDWGFSGTTFDRPGFQSVLQEVKAGSVANLVVTKFTKLGRNCLDCGKLIEHTIPKFGVTFHSVQEGIITPEQLSIMAQIPMALLSLCKGERGGRA